MVLALLSSLPVQAQDQYGATDYTTPVENPCEGVIYDGRPLGAIGALTAEEIAALPDEQRCLIGSARYLAGDLPPAPEGYVWGWDYSLIPESYYFTTY